LRGHRADQLHRQSALPRSSVVFYSVTGGREKGIRSWKVASFRLAELSVKEALPASDLSTYARKPKSQRAEVRNTVSLPMLDTSVPPKAPVMSGGRLLWSQKRYGLAQLARDPNLRLHAHALLPAIQRQDDEFVTRPASTPATFMALFRPLTA
jgi:hypothetical protein